MGRLTVCGITGGGTVQGKEDDGGWGIFRSIREAKKPDSKGNPPSAAREIRMPFAKELEELEMKVGISFQILGLAVKFLSFCWLGKWRQAFHAVMTMTDETSGIQHKNSLHPSSAPTSFESSPIQA